MLLHHSCLKCPINDYHRLPKCSLKRLTGWPKESDVMKLSGLELTYIRIHFCCISRQQLVCGSWRQHTCLHARARCTATANLQACTSSWLIVGCGQPQYGNCGPVQTSTAVFHEFSWAAFYTDFQDAMTPSHSLWGLPLHSSPSETSIKMLHTPMVKMYIFPCDRKHINASLVSYS